MHQQNIMRQTHSSQITDSDNFVKSIRHKKNIASVYIYEKFAIDILPAQINQDENQNKIKVDFQSVVYDAQFVNDTRIIVSCRNMPVIFVLCRLEFMKSTLPSLIKINMIFQLFTIVRKIRKIFQPQSNSQHMSVTSNLGLNSDRSRKEIHVNLRLEQNDSEIKDKMHGQEIHLFNKAFKSK